MYQLLMTRPKGFSLIEVVISTTVLSVVMLAVSTLIVQQQKATSQLSDQLNKIEITRNIETILKDGLACQQTLSGVYIPPSASNNVTHLRDNLGNIIYSSLTNFQNIGIGQISVKNNTVPGPSSSGFVDITVPIRALRSNIDLKPISLKVNVTVNPSRIVSSCSSTSALPGYFICNCTSWYWRGSVVSPSNLSGTLCYRPNGCSGGCHSPSHTWSCTAL